MSNRAMDRIPVDPAYSEKLGKAMFIFARLEWQAVWCCEKIAPGSIAPLKERTAGGVAKTLARLAPESPKAAQRDLEVAARRFLELVEMRNGLAHGRPCTAPDGEQRLSRDGFIWTPEAIDKVANEFAECDIELNRLYYGPLRGTDVD